MLLKAHVPAVVSNNKYDVLAPPAGEPVQEVVAAAFAVDAVKVMELITKRTFASAKLKIPFVKKGMSFLRLLNWLVNKLLNFCPMSL